jgi:hypothetical protein
MRLFLIFTLLLAIPLGYSASAPQKPSQPVLTPVRQMQFLSFLSGRWVGDSVEGSQEEYWSQPMGGSMIGTFREMKDGNAVFYEFWAIEVEDGALVFKMKHFNRGLIGWEDKADMVRLSASIGGMQDVIFAKPDGSLSLRYTRKGDQLRCIVRHVKDGKTAEETFQLHRAK